MTVTTEKRFHINPDTKKAGPCEAQVACRWKLGDDEHAHTAEIAYRRQAEREGLLSPKPLKKTKRYTAQIDVKQLKALAQSEMVKHSIPRVQKQKRYYATTDAKHFGANHTAGSKFTAPEIERLEDVVALAYLQRGSTDGDDREKLFKLGVRPKSLSEGVRYLVVETPGKLGARPLSDFPQGTKFKAMRTKDGGRVGLVALVTEQAQVAVGVVIMGHSDKYNRDVVVTAHPGLPGGNKRGASAGFAAHEGEILTAEEAVEIAGTNDLIVNTIAVDPSDLTEEDLELTKQLPVAKFHYEPTEDVVDEEEKRRELLKG